jgi:hypothetical protein
LLLELRSQGNAVWALATLVFAFEGGHRLRSDGGRHSALPGLPERAIDGHIVAASGARMHATGALIKDLGALFI